MNHKSPAQTPFLIYARKSKHDKPGQSASVDEQITACRQHLAESGWTEAGVFVDDGISGSKNVNRPGWNQMLSEIPNHRGVVVIAWHLDRLTRQGFGVISNLLDLLSEQGGGLITVQGGVDTTADSGRLALAVLSEVARLEAQNTRARVMRSVEARVSKGQRHSLGTGKARMFGYMDGTGMELHPVEAAAVREAVDGLLERGDSFGYWAAEFNRRGLFTTRPQRDEHGNVIAHRRWNASKLSSYMKRASLAGIREYGQTGVRTYPEGDDQWPAIITEEESTKLRNLHPKVDRSRINKLTSLWDGLVYCYCGAPMYHNSGNQNGKTVPRFICSAQIQQTLTYPPHENGTKTNSIKFDHLNPYLHRVVSVFSRDYLSAHPEMLGTNVNREQRLAELDAELEAIANERENVKAMGRKGHLQSHELDEEFAGLDKRKNEASQERTKLEDGTEEARAYIARIINESEGAFIKSEGVTDTWALMFGEHHRWIVNALVERIEIGPGRRGVRSADPNRIKITWKNIDQL